MLLFVDVTRKPIRMLVWQIVGELMILLKVLVPINLYSMKRIYFAISLLILTTATAQNIQEEIRFESANPFSLSDIILHLDEQEKQEVFGQLTIPIDSLNPRKISCYPWCCREFRLAQSSSRLFKNVSRFRVCDLELNSFKSRGITSTVGSQDQVTIAGIILDAYRALEALAKHPQIDANRVAITGWSLGGGVTLFSGWLPVKNAISKEHSFAAHLAMYPPALSILKTSNSRLLQCIFKLGKKITGHLPNRVETLWKSSVKKPILTSPFTPMRITAMTVKAMWYTIQKDTVLKIVYLR